MARDGATSLPYQVEGTVRWVGESKVTKKGRYMTPCQLDVPRADNRVDRVNAFLMGTDAGPLAVVQGENGIAVGQVVLDTDQEGKGRGLTVFIYEWDPNAGSAPIVRDAERVAAGRK